MALQGPCLKLHGYFSLHDKRNCANIIKVANLNLGRLSWIFLKGHSNRISFWSRKLSLPEGTSRWSIRGDQKALKYEDPTCYSMFEDGENTIANSAGIPREPFWLSAYKKPEITDLLPHRIKFYQHPEWSYEEILPTTSLISINISLIEAVRNERKPHISLSDQLSYIFSLVPSQHWMKALGSSAGAGDLRDQAGQYRDCTLTRLRVEKLAESLWISENTLWNHKLVVNGNNRKLINVNYLHLLPWVIYLLRSVVILMNNFYIA